MTAGPPPSNSHQQNHYIFTVSSVSLLNKPCISPCFPLQKWLKTQPGWRVTSRLHETESMKLVQCVKLCSWPGTVGGVCPILVGTCFLQAKTPSNDERTVCICWRIPMLEGRNNGWSSTCVNDCGVKTHIWLVVSFHNKRANVSNPYNSNISVQTIGISVEYGHKPCYSMFWIYLIRQAIGYDIREVAR